MDRFNLNGIWKLYFFPQGDYDINHPDELENTGLVPIDASVPGNVELDLSKAGLLPDDLYSADNIYKVRAYESYDWWYVCNFSTPDGIDGKAAELCFHGVDCLARYWLNGIELGTSANMFIEHRVEVTCMLRSGTSNTLAVHLSSAMLEGMKKQYTPDQGLLWGQTNIEHIWIRKAAHSYGWDIMPRALSAGLWRPVELIVHDKHEIKDLYIYTKDITNGRASLGVFYSIDIEAGMLSDMEMRISGSCEDSSFDVKYNITASAGTKWVDVENARLWWPAGYGNPDLYTVKLQILHKGTILTERELTVGIRKAELLRTDMTSTSDPGEFLFKVNNTPILCKGSNWVPADAFHSRDAERYEKMLGLFVEAGCNIVRCWGGNVYEDHAFFNFCDRNGIMVWQDFAMACAIYPQTEDFRKQMVFEAEAVIKKLRMHPSLILWSGDNECDENALAAGLNPNDNIITRKVLPEVIRQHDPFRPYLPSSPYYSPAASLKKNAQLLPERHLWGPRDYYKSRYYTESTAHFVSEIGYHGCPNLSSIRRFIDEDHLWPWQDNDQWITHATSPRGRKGSEAGRIKLMSDQIRELFGFSPDNLQDFIIASQISQAEAKKFFIEMTRLKKWRRTGIVWWNMVDGWPQFSDAVVDYYFGKKLAYYYISRVQQPVCIMVDEPENWHVRVVAGNDSGKAAQGKYRIWDADTGETCMEGEFRVKANENAELGRIRTFASDKRLLLIQWTIDGEVYGNHYLLGYPPISYESYRKWLPQIAALRGEFGADEVGK